MLQIGPFGVCNAHATRRIQRLLPTVLFHHGTSSCQSCSCICSTAAASHGRCFPAEHYPPLTNWLSHSRSRVFLTLLHTVPDAIQSVLLQYQYVSLICHAVYALAWQSTLHLHIPGCRLHALTRTLAIAIACPLPVKSSEAPSFSSFTRLLTPVI